MATTTVKISRVPVIVPDGDAATHLLEALRPRGDSAIILEPADAKTAALLEACAPRLPSHVEMVHAPRPAAAGYVYLAMRGQRLCVEDTAIAPAPLAPAPAVESPAARDVLDGLRLCVWLLDGHGLVLDANQAARDAPGGVAPRSTLEECPWWAHDAAARRRVSEAVTHAAGGQIWEGDLELSSAPGADAGEHTTLHLRVAPATAAPDSLLVASAADVTAHRGAQQRMERLNAKLNAMLESAPVGLGFLDREHRFVRVNDGLAQINGITPSQHLGRRLHEVVPAAADDVAPLIDRVLQTGQRISDVELSGEVAASPGLERHWLCSFFPVAAEGGGVELVGAVVMEVTRQKRIEGALRESERRFRAMAEALPAVAWMADRHMRWSYANPRLRELTGRPEESAFGESWLGLIDDRDRDRTRLAVRRSVQTAEPLHIEHRIKVRDDASHWFLTRARPILDEQGNCVRWFGTSTEIHQLKSAQQLLRRRLVQLGAIYRLSDAVARSDSRRQLYASAIDAIVDALGADCAAIFVADRHGNMHVRASRGLDEHCRDALARLNPCAAPGSGCSATLAEDVRRDLEGPLREEALASDLGAIAFIPLQFGRRLLGTLALGYRTPHRFAEDELHVAQTIAGHISFAIERRRADRVLRASEERFRAAFEQAAVGVAYSEPSGRFTRVNDRLCQITGYSREELLERNFADITHPDDAEFDLDAARRLLRGEIDIHSREKRYVRKDGAAVWVHLTASVVRSRNGEVKHFLAVIEDINDRRRAEEELHLRDRAIAAASNGVVISEAHGDLRMIFVNDGFERLTGYRREEVLGRSCRLLQGEQTDGQTLQQISRALREQSECHVTLLNYRKDGTPFWNELVISPIRDSAGTATHFVGVLTDVTELKQAQEQAEFLMAELNHRVKNCLATVLSIADQTARGSQDLESFRLSFEGRMQALSHAHSLLSHDQWSGTTLRTLLDAVGKPFIGREPRLEISGPEVRISPKAALSLSLILHELCTNAAKYGSLSVEGGRVRISWGPPSAEDGVLTLRWEETGGPPARPPSRKGFGTKLFERSVQYELGGRVALEFLPEGLACQVEFPLRSHTGGFATESAG